MNFARTYAKYLAAVCGMMAQAITVTQSSTWWGPMIVSSLTAISVYLVPNTKPKGK